MIRYGTMEISTFLRVIYYLESVDFRLLEQLIASNAGPHIFKSENRSKKKNMFFEKF